MYYICYMMKLEEKATSIRLGVLKAEMQKEAMRLDRSLHWLILKALREYVKTIKK